MRKLFTTGWGRLFILAWAWWAGWRWTEIDAETHWRSEATFLAFLFQALVFPLIVWAAALWVLRGFKRGQKPT